MALARQEQVKHFIYTSIVGIEHFPKYFYYKVKLGAERMIETSGVAFTILRATQFHYLLDLVLKMANYLPFIWLPTNLQFQSVDTGEVAVRLVQIAAESAMGHLPDMGGPEVLRSGDMAREWLKIRRIRKAVIDLPLWGETVDAFRRGMNTSPAHAVDRIIWAEWVAREYKAMQRKTIHFEV